MQVGRRALHSRSFPDDCSSLTAALAIRESSLKVGIDRFWSPLAMLATQDMVLPLQFRKRLVLHRERLPHHGPVLLAPTHRARWDALLLPLSLIHISEPTRLLSIGDGGVCV